MAILLLVAAPGVLSLAFFEAKERIHGLVYREGDPVSSPRAAEEEIQDRAWADFNALVRTTLSFPGIPTASVRYAADAYNWLFVFSAFGIPWLAFRRARAAQAVRDQEAEYALLALRAGARPPRLVGCFLRSFNLDHLFGQREMTLTEQAKERRRVRWSVDAFLDRNGLERKLSASFEGLPDSPIICSLGRRQTGSGFGRIETSDSDWRDVISTFLHQADFFVLIFASSSGTSWELNELGRNGLIDRTLFILPSSAMLKSQSALEAYEVERGCKQLFSELSKIGYAPPTYEEGSAFYFKDKQAVPIYSNDAISAKAIALFVAGIPPRTSVPAAR